MQQPLFLFHDLPLIGIAADPFGQDFFGPFLGAEEGMVFVIPTFLFLGPGHLVPGGLDHKFQGFLQGLGHVFGVMDAPAQEMEPGAAAEGRAVQIPFDPGPQVQGQQMLQRRSWKRYLRVPRSPDRSAAHRAP